MAANDRTYENEFSHEGALEEIMSKEQNPLQPIQVVQYG